MRVHPGIVGVCWVRAGTPCDSFGADGFTRVRLGGHRVYSGWLGSRGFALEVVGGCSLRSRGCALDVVGGRWVHVGEPWNLSGSSGCLVSRGCSLAFVGLIRGRWVDSGAPLCRLAYSG